MDDELLSDILAAERDIRLQIDALEQQTAERLEQLGQELDQMLGNESRTLLYELEQAQSRVEQSAQQEADALLAEARAFALRLENLDTLELERVVIRHLSRILPEGTDDRQDEQT
jgi:predicted component of type VI protein secretion system